MLSLGTVLHDRYRVDRMLEIGALEAQYVGWDLTDNAAVIITELMPQPDLDAESLQSLQSTFEREAALLAELAHPGIAGVRDYFCMQGSNADGDTAETYAYLIQPALGGQTLAELLEQEGPLPEDRVVAWGIQILDALAHAHGHGVRHRDIAPDNILITPDGRAALANFEILALWNPHDPRTWTAKRVMGTPEYAPPERWGMRDTRIDPRSDIYSLGASLYHALTGEQPITAGERTSNPYQFLQVKALSPRVSDRIKAVILKAMALPPDKRYQSATEMADALRGTDSAGTAASVAPPPAIILERRRFRERSHVGVVGWIGSGFALLAAALIGLQMGAARQSPTPEAVTSATSVREPTGEATPVLDGITAAEIAVTATPGAADPSELDPRPNSDTPREGEPADVERAAITPSPASVIDTLAPSPPADWELLTEDPFDDNANQWLINEYEDDWGSVSRGLSEGTYRWVVDADQPVGRWCTPSLEGQAVPLDDFFVAVDAYRQTGPEAAAYGLILRLSEGNYYQFSVRDDGYYQFSLWYGYAWQPVIDWTQTTLVASGEANRLTVVAQGSRFEFYINDEFADRAEDDQIAIGEVGLSMSTAATEGDAVFVFDNFELWRPQS